MLREELERVKNEFGDARRTEITAASGDINLEDLIAQGRCCRHPFPRRLCEIPATDRL